MKEENIIKRNLKDWNLGKTDFKKIDSATITDSVEYSTLSESEGQDEMQRYVNIAPDAYAWLKSQNLTPQEYVNNLLHQQMQQPL
jgi:hypothetical protein